jgi:hypothetical protein
MMVKILFMFFSGVLDEWTVETLWAQTVNAEKNYYKIDNIPFYAAIASGDMYLRNMKILKNTWYTKKRLNVPEILQYK